MKKFHVNPATGVASECRAQPGNCRFGKTDEHYDSMTDAQRAFEKTMNEPLIGVKKKAKPVKVYRAGDLTPPETYFPDLDQFLTKIDRFAPEGRQTRRGAIFASPDMRSHGRWINGVTNKTSHEITVNPDEVYVYSVEAYENASARDYAPDVEDRMKAFWATGMTLTNWNKWAKENKPERGSWEIIMPPSSIISAKTVSNKFIIENVDDNDASSVNWALEPSRAQSGLIWRKNKLSDEDLALVKEDAERVIKDKELVEDIEAIYRQKGYKEDDIYASNATILRSINKIRKSREQDTVESKEAQAQVINAFTEYVKLADTLR